MPVLRNASWRRTLKESYVLLPVVLKSFNHEAAFRSRIYFRFHDVKRAIHDY